jgi:hypothetical protein
MKPYQQVNHQTYPLNNYICNNLTRSNYISNHRLIVPYASNSWWHVNFKNNNAFITLQCCVIVTHYNETTCAMAWCMDIKKTRSPNILCPCSSIVCANILCPHSSTMCVIGGNKQRKKNWRKRKEKETKVNLILCHVCSMIPMGPYAFRHNHCTLFSSF